MIDVYRRLVRNCKTINMLNKCHIDIENRMTPTELHSLRSAITSMQDMSKVFHPDLIDASPSTLQRVWLDKLHLLYASNGKHAPENFVRRRLRQDVLLFEGYGERTDKTLAICFSGSAQRMMMPMPVFLQNFNSAKTDVAFIRDPSRNGYRLGIRGIADNLELSIDRLKDILMVDNYQKTVSIGVSAGGIPAILTALRLNSAASLSVGGGHPDDPKWVSSEGIQLRETLKLYLKESKHMPTVFLVFGADYPPDKIAAEELSRIFPAKLIAVSMPGGKVDHNALHPIVASGQLGKLLETTVLG